jgi:hypothetical protein
MSVAEIRKELHKAIDDIENEELLQAMLTLLVQKGLSKDHYAISDEQLYTLHEREEKYRTGKESAESVEEFKRKMDKKYGL